MTPRSVSFTVYGLAQPKGSFRLVNVGKGAHRRTIGISDNRNLKRWELQVKNAARVYRADHHDPPIFTGAVRLRAVFYLPRPASVSIKQRPYPSVKPDLSKLVRGAEDALTGVLWQDDALVVSLTAVKCYTNEPARAELTIEELEPAYAEPVSRTPTRDVTRVLPLEPQRRYAHVHRPGSKPGA